MGWTCYEAGVYDEVRPSAIVVVADGGFPHFPDSGIMKTSPDLPSTPIPPVQFEYALALEATQAFLTQGKCLSLCRFEVRHEGGEVFDRGSVPRLSRCCCHLPTLLPREKADRVDVRLGGDVERCSWSSSFARESEEIDVHL